MSNTIFVETSTKEIDADNAILNSSTQQTSASYSEKSAGVYTIASGASYTALPFGGVSSATYIRVSAQTALSIKFNAGSEIITGVTDFSVYGIFTALSVSQSSGASVDVKYEIFG